MQNKKGYIGLLAILVVVIFAVLFMLYLFKGNWFGSGIDVSGKNLNPANSSEKNDSAATKDINGQLDNLRGNVKSLQDAKDKEIMDQLK